VPHPTRSVRRVGRDNFRCADRVPFFLSFPQGICFCLSASVNRIWQFILTIMAYYLGIDAGATKTDCALSRDSTILTRATGGTIKVMRVSEEEAGNNLANLLHSVSSKAGVALNEISSTGVGLAGVSVPRIADWVRQALHARVSGDVVLSGDEVIALDAAFHGGRGVLVMAGTGSNMVGRTADGRLAHVGGWGPVVADEGSGGWIGKHAVRAIFDALDHADTTLLLDAVMHAWEITSVGALIDRANQLPGPDFSKLSPLTATCASQGDAYAQDVLRDAGRALAQYAVLTAQRVQAMEREQDDAQSTLPEIAFTGSILRHIVLVREAMRDAILEAVPGAQIQAEAVDSIEGALWRARESASNDSPLSTRERLGR
jgi:glucosamine kinase